ncbi:hypothetical protein DTO027B5_6328 [Paecilomyces variotii]|nr:hypothetical protein DTO027B3_3496 [Paecilomyces variotii]KAJ9331925.1 hypothetical protein DTO027B5_6328 [Paecilomyces variotii]
MGHFILPTTVGDTPAITRVVPLGLPLLLVIAISFSVLRKLFQKSIPTPKFGLPVIGDALAYGKDPITFVRDATAKVGPVFRINMLLNSIIFLRRNDLNKMYLETREDVWSFGDGMGLFLNKVVVPGYFTHLKRMVSSLNRGINRTAALEHYRSIAAEEAEKSLSNWASKTDVEIFEEASKFAHKVIVRCLMGQDFYEKNIDELYDLLHRMEADIGHPFNFLFPDWVPHPPAKRLGKARDRVADIFHERLNEREQNPEKWRNSLDYVSYTLNDASTAHLKEFYPAHHTLLMFAAHTSTVASIAWTIIQLLRSPAHMEQLREALSDCPNIHKSPELLAVIKETGRRYSGVNMLRLARQPVQLPGTDITVPTGSVVSISPYLIHHDPATYKDPELWDPERWLRPSEVPDQKGSSKQVTFLQFGAGSHRCPGENMAGMITREMISTLVKNYRVEWGTHGPPKDFSKLDFTKIGSPWLVGDAAVSIRRLE